MRRSAIAIAAIGFLLAPCLLFGQQQQNKQNGQTRLQKSTQGSGPNQQVAPETSPLNQNPEGLLPVLPMGPLPRPNGSPNYTNQYTNQTVPQTINQQMPFYRSMVEILAGGNTSTPIPNQLSNGGLNGVAQNGTTRGGKNSRGLSTQPSTQQNNQNGTGQHANPGQGQGQTP